MSCIRANSLDEAIVKLSGEGRRIIGRTSVSGGDINRVRRLDLSDGTALFMKSNTVGHLPFFQAEMLGLEALRGTGTIGVPEPLALGTDARQGISFLLMEYLEPAPRSKAYWETFGRELALLHRAGCASLVPGGRFGFAADNFIGAAPQRNSPGRAGRSFSGTAASFPRSSWPETLWTGGPAGSWTGCWSAWRTYCRSQTFPPCSTETCGAGTRSAGRTARPGSWTRRPMWAALRRTLP